MNLTIYTDGGSSGNPGPAALAFVFCLGDKIILKHSENIGIATNNFAEYSAVLKALKKAKELKSIARISFFSDSSLLVNQLNGLFKVKDAKIRSFVFEIRIAEQELGVPVSYTHIPREKNKVADFLVKKTLYS